MEATPFEIILVAVCRTTVGTVAACWLVSVLASGVRNLLRSLIGGPEKADQSFAPHSTAWFTHGAGLWPTAHRSASGQEPGPLMSGPVKHVATNPLNGSTQREKFRSAGGAASDRKTGVSACL